MLVRFYVADQNPHRDRTRGITSYTDGLLRSLAQREDLSLDAVSSRSSYAPPVHLHRFPFATDHIIGRLAADHGAYRLVPGRPTLWHFPKGYVGGRRPREPVVATIHDLIIAHTADKYPRTRSHVAFLYWIELTKRTLRAVDHIITVSEHARDQIQAHAEVWRVRVPPISVTYQGARWENMAGSARRPKADYVLHLGSIEPHKRTETLLDLWAALSQRAGRELPRLLVVGEVSAHARRCIRMLRQVELRAPVPSDQLGELMEGALALVISSEMEGFGVPAVEAYYRGTPVAYVEGTALEEILGSTEGSFSLDDADSLFDTLLRLSSRDAATIGKAALHLRERFAWSMCADRTMQVYRRVLA